MPVTVTRLQGSDIPEHIRGPGVDVVFRVTDDNGQVQYLLDDVEAAKTAVRASEDQRDTDS